VALFDARSRAREPVNWRAAVAAPRRSQACAAGLASPPRSSAQTRYPRPRRVYACSYSKSTASTSSCQSTSTT